jgi:hypothetical protein
MNPLVIAIASDLTDHFLHQLSASDVSIFLCGGSNPTEQALRRKVGTELVALRSKYRYSIFYPEDMFIELVLGHQKQDLLTLETLLARSVGAVTILLQSPGTFTELGAFSNHDLLKNKLVVVVDPKYRRAQSFINTGPIRHLIKETSSRVLFLEMTEANLDSLVGGVAEATRDVARKHPPERDLTNPIMCYRLYLALLSVFDPMPRRAFAEIARELERSSPALAQIAAETVVNGLINKGDALLVSQNVTISRKGIDTLYTEAGSARRRAALEDVLSKLRLSALNGMLRKRYKRFWGEAG